ncbi:hypothetical protein MNV49_000538 [Pseudohyphozyma bogoriensis]|nr:hypothetical protein MNV49_000538 [Pseudohyphozyma bogoriensis]
MFSSVQMRRSPGLWNLNQFTRDAFAEEEEASKPLHINTSTPSPPARHLWSLDSRNRSLRGPQDDLSSPELPASPDSPFHSGDEDMSSESEFSSDEDDFSPLPCIARRGGFHRAVLVESPVRRRDFEQQQPPVSPPLTGVEFLHLSSPRIAERQFDEEDWEIKHAQIQSWQGFAKADSEANKGLGVGLCL